MAIVVLVMVDGCFWSAPSSQPWSRHRS